MSDLHVRPVAGRYGRRRYRGRTMSVLCLEPAPTVPPIRSEANGRDIAS
jgi:hypothetical protein